jgi:hypothetical protein
MQQNEWLLFNNTFENSQKVYFMRCPECDWESDSELNEDSLPGKCKQCGSDATELETEWT